MSQWSNSSVVRFAQLIESLYSQKDFEYLGVFGRNGDQEMIAMLSSPPGTTFSIFVNNEVNLEKLNQFKKLAEEKGDFLKIWKGDISNYLAVIEKKDVFLNLDLYSLTDSWGPTYRQVLTKIGNQSRKLDLNLVTRFIAYKRGYSDIHYRLEEIAQYVYEEPEALFYERTEGRYAWNGHSAYYKTFKEKCKQSPLQISCPDVTLTQFLSSKEESSIYPQLCEHIPTLTQSITMDQLLNKQESIPH